jgi:hypothetical protein
MIEAIPDTYPSLFYGYAVMWGIFGLYLLSLGIRLSALEKKNENN